MPAELDLSGLSAFIAGLDNAIEQGADETADDVVDLARQIAPVDEGDFQGSIEKQPGETAETRKVIAGGEKAPHGIYVEYGVPSNTAYPAQPTLGPAAAAIDPGLRTAEKLRALAERSRR